MKHIPVNGIAVHGMTEIYQNQGAGGLILFVILIFFAMALLKFVGKVLLYVFTIYIILLASIISIDFILNHINTSANYMISFHNFINTIKYTLAPFLPH